MKRVAITVACVGLFGFGSLATSAGAPKIHLPQYDFFAKPLGSAGPGQANIAALQADLAVTKAMGTLQGNTYYLGGTVKNLGPVDYARRPVVLGQQYHGRRLQVLVVINGGLSKGGSSYLLRSLIVPSLKAGQTWTLPTIAIPANQVPGPATAQFVLMLTPGDRNTTNDWSQTWVTGGVR